MHYVYIVYFKCFIYVYKSVCNKELIFLLYKKNIDSNNSKNCRLVKTVLPDP